MKIILGADIGGLRHGKAKIRVVNKSIIIEPVLEGMSGLAGFLKGRKKIDAGKIRDKIDYGKW
jgi:hypothetical protein